MVIKKPISMIFIVWLGYLFTIYCAQKLGFGFGYHIWPQGEDRNWIGFIQDLHSADMVKSFWKVDGRNPLAAWYWYAASPIIVKSPWGLYFLSLIPNLILSLSIFALLNRISKGEFPIYSISVALITLVWNFSFRFDNSAITSYLALNFTILSLFFYCGFIDSQRKSIHQILLSLLCYFLAFTTYTLQSGALVGIILLGIFRTQNLFLKERIINIILDSTFFFAFFYLYNLIWYEVTPKPSYVFFTYDTSKISSMFIQSISKFIFPPSLMSFINEVIGHWSAKKISLIFITGFIAYVCLFFNKYTKKFLLNDKSANAPYFWVISILLAISLPTILVESTNNTFFPGSRSYFIQQIFQPLLYVAILFAVINLLFHKHAKRLSLICVAIFAATILTISFYYNSILMQKTYYQMKLAEELNNLNFPLGKEIYFIVKIDKNKSPYIGSEPNLSCYARTVLNNKNSFIKILYDVPPPPIFKDNWKVTFENNLVKNTVDLWETKIIPYEKILIVSFDGTNLVVPKIIEKSYFEGFQIDWNRDSPIHQNGVVA